MTYLRTLLLPAMGEIFEVECLADCNVDGEFHHDIRGIAEFHDMWMFS